MFNKSPEARPVNVVEVVGVEPLQVPEDTPPEQVLRVTAKLEAAREVLKKVLPPHPGV